MAVFGLSPRTTKEAWYIMLHVDLDLSRRRLDFDLICEDGSRIERGAVAPHVAGLHGLVERVAVYREPVCAAIESMNGARCVHNWLEEQGWRVEIADAQKVKGLAPLACKTDRIDAWVLGRTLPPGSGARDLAARPRGARRAGACKLAASSRASLHGAEEPDSPDTARVRHAVPGVRPVRRQRPGSALPACAA